MTNVTRDDRPFIVPLSTNRGVVFLCHIHLEGPSPTFMRVYREKGLPQHILNAVASSIEGSDKFLNPEKLHIWVYAFANSCMVMLDPNEVVLDLQERLPGFNIWDALRDFGDRPIPGIRPFGHGVPFWDAREHSHIGHGDGDAEARWSGYGAMGSDVRESRRRTRPIETGHRSLSVGELADLQHSMLVADIAKIIVNQFGIMAELNDEALEALQGQLSRIQDDQVEVKVKLNQIARMLESLDRRHSMDLLGLRQSVRDQLKGDRAMLLGQLASLLMAFRESPDKEGLVEALIMGIEVLLKHHTGQILEQSRTNQAVMAGFLEHPRGATPAEVERLLQESSQRTVDQVTRMVEDALKALNQPAPLPPQDAPVPPLTPPYELGELNQMQESLNKGGSSWRAWAFLAAGVAGVAALWWWKNPEAQTGFKAAYHTES